jgi:GAF domain-containing protein
MDNHEFDDLLRRTMAELTEKFTHTTEIDVTLRTVTAAAVDLIDGVDSADILVISEPDRYESLAATSQLAVDLDGVQQRFGQGPCVDAACGDSVVRSDDLRKDQRWPRFAESALAAGVHSMLSFQLYFHDNRQAALNLVGLKPYVFNSDAEAVAAMLATHAAIALIAEDKQLQFQSALASRDIIGQAKGVIMERFSVDAVRAFELLRAISQNTNTRLADVAADLIARGSAGHTDGKRTAPVSLATPAARPWNRQTPDHPNG